MASQRDAILVAFIQCLIDNTPTPLDEQIAEMVELWLQML
jgi:hypothetical protein